MLQHDKGTRAQLRDIVHFNALAASHTSVPLGLRSFVVPPRRMRLSACVRWLCLCCVCCLT